MGIALQVTLCSGASAFTTQVEVDFVFADPVSGTASTNASSLSFATYTSDYEFARPLGTFDFSESDSDSSPFLSSQSSASFALGPYPISQWNELFTNVAPDGRPQSISAFVSTSGPRQLTLGSGSHFSSDAADYSKPTDDDPDWYFLSEDVISSASSSARANLDSRGDIVIQSVTASVDVKYAIGSVSLPPRHAPQDAGSDTYRLGDPGSIIKLTAGGTTVVGSSMVSEWGDTFTFGDVSYDANTGQYDFDTSSLVGVTLSTERVVPVELSVTEFLPGDVNLDDVVDDADIDLLFASLAPGSAPAGFNDPLDTNRDGLLVGGVGASSEVAFLVEDVLLTVFGDANLDGFVGSSDLSKVLSNWGSVGATWSDGDFNGDTTVNQTDLNSVLTNWGYNRSTQGTSFSVPEPATAALLSLGALAMLRRRA